MAKSFALSLMLIIFVMTIYAVSYTHLDVYKRQGKGREADVFSGAGRTIAAIRERIIRAATNPVSYTHLVDVQVMIYSTDSRLKFACMERCWMRTTLRYCLLIPIRCV